MKHAKVSTFLCQSHKLCNFVSYGEATQNLSKANSYLSLKTLQVYAYNLFSETQHIHVFRPTIFTNMIGARMSLFNNQYDVIGLKAKFHETSFPVTFP